MRDQHALIEKLNRVRGELQAVLESVPPEKWQKPPANGGWSAAEVIAHLTMVETAVVDAATKKIQQEPRQLPFWKRIHFPPKLSEYRFKKVKTPIPIDPVLLADKQSMLDRYQGTRRRTLAFLDAHRQLDLGRWRWRHPFFGYLDGYTWFRTLYHHEIRHTKQLRGIVESIR